LIMPAATIWVFAPRFAQLALAAVAATHNPTRQRRRSSGFRRTWPTRALRGKEWTLLQGDLWLMSQSLMQLLYLLPPAFLSRHGFYLGSGAAALLVPIRIMVAGQLAGGLAWPASPARTHRITSVFGPFVVGLAVVAPIAGLVTTLGVATAVASATSIQFRLLVQAKRSHLWRRQTWWRIATFAEALSSSSWAGAGALAAASTWLTVIPGLIPLRDMDHQPGREHPAWRCRAPAIPQSETSGLVAIDGVRSRTLIPCRR
jgi:ABC-2 type transport system permease protein